MTIFFNSISPKNYRLPNKFHSIFWIYLRMWNRRFNYHNYSLRNTLHIQQKTSFTSYSSDVVEK